MDKFRNKDFDEPESDGSSDSTDKRKSFRRIGERFAEKTSMQGIPYIYHEKGILAKVIWTVLLLGAIGGMVYHLKFLIENYLEFRKSTKLELGRDNLQFPAVTICNTNIIKQRNLYDMEGAEALKDLVDALKPENMAPGSFQNKPHGSSNAGQSSTTVNVERGIQETAFSTSPAGHSVRSEGTRDVTTTNDVSRSLHNGHDKPLHRVSIVTKVQLPNACNFKCRPFKTIVS